MTKAQVAVRVAVGIGAVGFLGGCLGGGVESSEFAVCGDGMPGGMAVAGPVTEGQPERLVLVCFDDTSHTDSGWLTVYAAGEDGTLEEAASHGVGRQPGVPVVADLDGDGIDDLLVANTGGLSEEHYLSFFKGQADGAFEEERHLSAVRADFVANDVNGDGTPDLVLPDQNAALLVEDPAKGGLRRRRLADVETRGRNGGIVPGLQRTEHFGVLVDRDAGKLHVYPAGGRGGFEIALPEDRPSLHSVLGVADMNGDELVDFVVAIQKDNSIERGLHLLLSAGDGNWDLSPAIEGVTAKPNDIVLASATGEAVHVFISPWADPDRDEFLDHFLVDADGRVRVQDAVEISHYPHSMTVADLDGEAGAELLVRDMEGGKITRIPLAQFETD